MTSTEVATTEPSWVKEYTGPTGAEGIDNDDLNIPRIMLAQAMTPAVKQKKLEDGDIFLNITEEALASIGDPLVIVPLIAYKEYILWKDRKDDESGIMARATHAGVDEEGGALYEWDKPNETFTTKIDGKHKVEWTTGKYAGDNGLTKWGSSMVADENSPPAATVHHNYICLLPEHDGLIAALSLSLTQVGRAKDFNAMLKLGNTPIFARKFILSSEDDSRGTNHFANYRFRPYGFVDEATMHSNEAIIKGFENINVNFDQQTEGAAKDTSEDL